MLSFLFRHAKLIYIIGGSLLTIGGALWSYLVTDKASDETKHLADAKAELNRQMESLNSIASEYFIANQQGDLIFVLAQQDNARQDVASLIYKGNMLDRATPVRNMIGALAIANQLDYRQTYDAYEKLNDETRANLSFVNFINLKEMEKEIIVKGQERVPFLLSQQFEIQKAINANEASRKRNRLIGLISSIIGTFLVLCANLISQKSGERKAHQ